MGLVSQVFSPGDLERLKGNRAIGHVRYSTTGSSNLTNAQPLTANTGRGQIAIGHNGNLINAAILREELEERGSIFQTTVDSEIIVHLLAQPPGNSSPLAALRRIQGAFSLAIMSEREIIGVRDPFGFRPLSIGKLDGAYVLSSETCAFDLIHAEFVREVEPGEVVIIDENGIRSEFPFQDAKRAFCIFEYVYFARPDSIISDINVARVRTEMGRELARLAPAEADIVVPVPDSGNYAALGFAEELGISYNHAFVRNHYIGRTFLQPTQLIRDFNVRVKLNLIKEAVAGKRVVVVDDSIVRGTTARARVVNSAGSRREGGSHASLMPAASICLPLRNRLSRSGEVVGQPVHDGTNPRLSRSGLDRIPRRSRDGACDRPAGKSILPRLLYGRLPGPGGSRSRQTHH